MWVPKVRLRVPWDQAEAWQRDEQMLDACWDASFEARDTVEFDAAWFILSDCHQDQGVLVDYATNDGTVVRVDGIEHLAALLDLSVDELHGESLSFVNRHGSYIAPWSVLLRLARRTAAVRPEPVLSAIAAEEAELQQGMVSGRTVDSLLKKGDSYYEPPSVCAARLREREPLFTKVREWCGQTATERFDEISGLREEVIRLRGLVERAAHDLEAAGRPYDARRLYKAIGVTPTKTTRKRR